MMLTQFKSDVRGTLKKSTYVCRGANISTSFKSEPRVFCNYIFSYFTYYIIIWEREKITYIYEEVRRVLFFDYWTEDFLMCVIPCKKRPKISFIFFIPYWWTFFILLPTFYDIHTTTQWQKGLMAERRWK